MTPFEGWQKEDDRIVAQPVLGFDAATFPGHALLRIRYATSQTGLDQQQGDALQVALTPAQAREMGQALTRLADAAEQQG
jgi:hypothetical protein